MAEPHNTPVPGSTPRATSPVGFLQQAQQDHAAPKPPAKPRVLHLGDRIRFNPGTFDALSSRFQVVRPSTPERQRPQFAAALRERRWGDFEAIVRPFWDAGGEMGRWDAELIDLLPPGVKVFASAGAGLDWVDTERMGERGIVCCDGGSASADAVADFSVAMIISTFRHLPWCILAATSRGATEYRDCHLMAPERSHNLRDQALGIVGMGNVGQRIAIRCRHGFGMSIHYHDIERKSSSIEQAVAATFHATLESLLQASDCVVLCAPAGVGSGTIVDASTLAHFRHGARFVNIAHGALVDEDALVAAMDERRVSAVALDVHADEPHPHRGLKRLAGHGRAMLTCHNAGGTVETLAGFEELSMRNVMAVLSGGQALSPVNLGHLKDQGTLGGAGRASIMRAHES
ncbi:Uncharacterized protein TCAP_06261 [Tolypocladium capitatum]|uniref:Glyoxylate reductase n=1 Tax=Tolypocladium capitatum TaxID=45235 RepID=A0A2K3Q8C7_9HYPO|nr:Uncharacterized protein TCAP_06261 [Tolypocladium capitatum]